MKSKNVEAEEEDHGGCICFFCAMEDTDRRRRRASLTAFFSDMPRREEESQVLVMSGLWSYAMARPDDPDLPSSGVLRCAAALIAKGLADKAWLRRHQNIYIPYYAAHILGSYTIQLPAFASLAVSAGAIPPLLSLLRGAMTWVEQRVAVRALGHLASFDATFPAVARHGHDLLPLAMRLATNCLRTVYVDFIGRERRIKYQRDLLTRGIGGRDMEARKAEEWASQLQCWSLYLLGCFAWRDAEWHRVICSDAGFLRELCGMWGGMANGDSPAGVGLMRILCRGELGRAAIAACPEAVESLCNLSRSSDDWQYMGIDCLLLLLSDHTTRRRVLPNAAPCLTDLVELQSLGARRNFGDTIAEFLLQKVEEEAGLVKEAREVKVERRRREEGMSEGEAAERREAARERKKEGNERFYARDVEGAVEKYGEALEMCPLKRKKERMVIYSNRAQCRLLLGDADAAVSDATRALALSTPANGHGKSLWRRAQAYDMKGMAKESLMDCLVFVNGWLDDDHGRKKGKMGKRTRGRVPYYVARMISEQMNRAGLFAGVREMIGAGASSSSSSEFITDEDN